MVKNNNKTMKILKTFEEYRFINVARNSEKDKNEPFLNVSKPKYKEEKQVFDRNKILRDCGINTYFLKDYDKLISKLGKFNLYATTPVVILYDGYGKKENHFRCYVKEKSENDKEKYKIDIFPNYSGTYGPGVPTGEDLDSWGEHDFTFIPKCIVTDLLTNEKIETKSLWQCIYKIIDIEEDKK